MKNLRFGGCGFVSTWWKVLKKIIPLLLYHMFAHFSHQFDSLVDLSQFSPIVIDVTYNTSTFSSMGYVLINYKWYKKESVQQ